LYGGQIKHIYAPGLQHPHKFAQVVERVSRRKVLQCDLRTHKVEWSIFQHPEVIFIINNVSASFAVAVVPSGMVNHCGCDIHSRDGFEIPG
jgi:hypothetical protein